MAKRIIVAVPIVLVILLAIFMQGYVLAAVAVLLACASQFEVVRAMDGNGKPVIKIVSFAFTAVLAVLFLFSIGSLYISYIPNLLTHGMVLAVFVIAVMATFIIGIISKKYDANSVINTTFTLLYPQLFMMLFYFIILDVKTGAVLFSQSIYLRTVILMLMVFIPAMLSDTFAYFIGKRFGKTKLCPTISPKKTVAGSVAGVVGGMVAGVLIYLLFVNNGAFINYLVAGAVLAVISQFGDLSASYIKRELQIKDFGKLLPGHGGIVDRIDSILFCIPIVYLLSNMFYLF